MLLSLVGRGGMVLLGGRWQCGARWRLCAGCVAVAVFVRWFMGCWSFFVLVRGRSYASAAVVAGWWGVVDVGGV